MDNHIDRWIDKWQECRQTIQDLEKKMQKYKDRVAQYMTDHGKETYQKNGLQVKRVSQTRFAVHKESLPQDVWNKYKTPSHVQYYTLTKTSRTTTNHSTDDT